MMPKGKQRGKGKFRPVPDGKGTKSQRRDEEIIDSAGKNVNDPGWYYTNEQTLKDAASFPFANPVGLPIDLGKIPGTNTNYRVTIPGIMTIKFTPTFGNASTLRDAVNVAAVNLYSFVRHVNSGGRNYESADLMMYVLAMDSLYMFHAWMKRVYGVARLYTPMNRYYPLGLLEAMAVDPGIVGDLAQLRYFINYTAVQLSSLRLPSVMTLFTRHQWLCTNLFTDSMSEKAQTYLYNPECYWKFNNTAENGTTLDPVGFVKANGVTLEEIQNLWNQLIGAVMTDEDVGIMSGDILKAFGDSVMVSPGIDENYITLPIFSDEVLSQIHNSRACGDLVRTGDKASIITQNPEINSGAIQTTYYCEWPAAQRATSLNALELQYLYNSYKDGVTPGDLMVGTRLAPVATVGAKTDDPGTHACYVQSCGSEIVNSYIVYTWSPVSNSFWRRHLVNYLAMTADAISQTTWEVLHEFIKLTNFDWHPLMYVQTLGSSSMPNTIDSPLADINNYTIIGENALRRMHDVAILAELDYRR